MFRIISLAFVIAKSSAYEDEDLWKSVFPDECLPAQLTMKHFFNYDVNYDVHFDVKDWDEMRELCEDVCGEPCEGSETGYQDYQNQEHCERLKHGDLEELYRTIIFDFDYRDHFFFVNGYNHDYWDYTFEREYMIAMVNVLCGNLTLECAEAALHIGHVISRDGETGAMHTVLMEQCGTKVSTIS